MPQISFFPRNDRNPAPFARVHERHDENESTWGVVSLYVEGVELEFYLQPGEDAKGYPEALERHKALRSAFAKILTELDALIEMAEAQQPEAEREGVAA